MTDRSSVQSSKWDVYSGDVGPSDSASRQQAPKSSSGNSSFHPAFRHPNDSDPAASYGDWHAAHPLDPRTLPSPYYGQMPAYLPSTYPYFQPSIPPPTYYPKSPGWLDYQHGGYGTRSRRKSDFANRHGSKPFNRRVQSYVEPHSLHDEAHSADWDNNQHALLDQQSFHRQDTLNSNELHHRGKSRRFKVFVRSRSWRSADEESGFGDPDQSIHKSFNSTASRSLPQTMHEIAQTRWSSAGEGREDVILTLKSRLQSSGEDEMPCHMRWL